MHDYSRRFSPLYPHCDSLRTKRNTGETRVFPGSRERERERDERRLLRGTRAHGSGESGTDGVYGVYGVKLARYAVPREKHQSERAESNRRSRANSAAARGDATFPRLRDRDINERIFAKAHARTYQTHAPTHTQSTHVHTERHERRDLHDARAHGRLTSDSRDSPDPAQHHAPYPLPFCRPRSCPPVPAALLPAGCTTHSHGARWMVDFWRVPGGFPPFDSPTKRCSSPFFAAEALVTANIGRETRSLHGTRRYLTPRRRAFLLSYIVIRLFGDFTKC